MSKIGNWFRNNLKGWHSAQMRGNVRAVERDSAGNFWYLSNFFDSVGGVRTDYNMTDVSDKSNSLLVCTPLSVVLGKVGSMFANAHLYVTDKYGNELDTEAFPEIRKLMSHPNPLQTGTGFLKEIEVTLKCFGYCPIFTVRSTRNSLPKAMYVIPPRIFHMVSTGALFRQYSIGDIVSYSYLEWNGTRDILEGWDYFVIYDSSAIVEGANMDIRFASQTDSLSMPVNNWIAAMAASNKLLVNGGPKGIIYSDYVDGYGNTLMTPTEKENIEDRLKNKYGILNKYPILASPIKLGWIPLDYDASQLKLLEEDNRCSRKICNAIGVDYSLFDDSKYDNKSIAEKSAYQSVVIPDSEKVAESFTAHICPEGIKISLDYSHIDCLQKDKSSSAAALQKTSSALVQLVDKGIITMNESRYELAKLIDIDPGNPDGEFRIVENSNGNGVNRDKREEDDE